jgi:hypothetical protein
MDADLLLALLTTLVGAGIGVAGTLYFYRAQQKTDFNRVVESVRDVRERVVSDSSAHHQRLDAVSRTTAIIESTLQALHREIAIIKTATDAGSIASVQTSLEALRSSYRKLDQEVAGLSGRIVKDFTEQQHRFMLSVRAEFAQAVEESKAELKRSLEKEISPLVPSVQQQAVLIERLMDLSGYAMLAMGQYQLQVVETQSSQALSETGERVARSVSELRADVKEVKERLDALPMLPLPRE